MRPKSRRRQGPRWKCPALRTTFVHGHLLNPEESIVKLSCGFDELMGKGDIKWNPTSHMSRFNKSLSHFRLKLCDYPFRIMVNEKEQALA